MSDGTPFLRVAADRIGAPGSARIAGKNAIPRHQRRQLVLNHPDRREDGCHSKANCTSTGFESHSTGWEVSIWGIPTYTARCELPPGTRLRTSARVKYLNRSPGAYGHRRSSAGTPRSYVEDQVTSTMHRRTSLLWTSPRGGRRMPAE